MRHLGRLDGFAVQMLHVFVADAGDRIAGAQSDHRGGGIVARNGAANDGPQQDGAESEQTASEQTSGGGNEMNSMVLYSMYRHDELDTHLKATRFFGSTSCRCGRFHRYNEVPKIECNNKKLVTSFVGISLYVCKYYSHWNSDSLHVYSPNGQCRIHHVHRQGAVANQTVNRGIVVQYILLRQRTQAEALAHRTRSRLCVVGVGHGCDFIVIRTRL